MPMSAAAPYRKPRLLPVEFLAFILAALLTAAAILLHWAPLSTAELLGFYTGGVCVWLTAREHIWNWPIGLANNLAFFVLFLESRLYADMSLQVVYFALGIYGWVTWVRGSSRGEPLRVTHTTVVEWVCLAIFVAGGTVALRPILTSVGGAAPFWDALTTALSLAAQYLLCRKRLENWYLWIAVDLIYIPLYLSRQLALTAVLYAVFLLMCLAGLRGWRQRLRAA